jgi:hypothetical protein
VGSAGAAARARAGFFFAPLASPFLEPFDAAAAGGAFSFFSFAVLFLSRAAAGGLTSGRAGAGLAFAGAAYECAAASARRPPAASAIRERSFANGDASDASRSTSRPARANSSGLGGFSRLCFAAISASRAAEAETGLWPRMAAAPGELSAASATALTPTSAAPRTSGRARSQGFRPASEAAASAAAFGAAAPGLEVAARR